MAVESIPTQDEKLFLLWLGVEHVYEMNLRHLGISISCLVTTVQILHGLGPGGRMYDVLWYLLFYFYKNKLMNS